MAQAVVDNAGAMSFDRDVTAAQSISSSRNVKWFRKGPIQSVLQVNINAIRQETYLGIRADLSDGLVGPYDISLPSVVVGDAISGITVNGASESGSTINLARTGAVTLPKGSIIRITGVALSYIVVADASLTSAGVDVMLDQPLASTPADDAVVTVGSDITFSMNLLARPRASQGPTGLVVHDGPFQFAEVVG